LIKIWVNHVEHVAHVHTSIHAHTDAHARTHAYTMFELDPASPVVSPLARRRFRRLAVATSARGRVARFAA
jgi:hypothetical protein